MDPTRKEHLSSENETVLRLFIIAVVCFGAVITPIYSLTHGIIEIHPSLHILPIIIVVYF